MNSNMKKENLYSASLTVEAAFVLPILTILVMNLFSAIEIYRIHSSIAESLWQNGRISTRNMYITTVADEVLPEIDKKEIYGSVSHFLSLAITRQKVIDELNEEPVWKRIVSLGELGLYISNNAEDDILKLECSYLVHPLFPFWTLTTKQISNCYYGHSWTGYDIRKGFVGTDGVDEEYVFITETGTVYHRNRNCSYLNPSITLIQASALENSRNENGGKYERCSCCEESVESQYYITKYGTNYHASLECHGLKRTIQAIKLSQIGGRDACTKCSS